jgi:hypothetical protein
MSGSPKRNRRRRGQSKSSGIPSPKRTIDVERIFKAAVGFEYAMHIVGNATAKRGRTLGIDGQGIATVIPMCVIAAFSCELYLKCLYCLDGGGKQYEHKLLELYKALGSNRRQRIQEIYPEEFNRNSLYVAMRNHQPDKSLFELETALKRGSKVFEQWRYFYEGGVDSSPIPTPVITTIKTVILEIKPDWNNIIKAVGSLSTYLTP